MNRMKTCLTLVLTCIIGMGSLMAQSPSTQVDYLESTGKIYVVIAIIAVIFIGIIALLFTLERRVAKLEKSDER